MKIFFLLLSLWLLIQFSNAQTRIAIKGGFNYSTAAISEDGKKLSKGFKSGLGLGVLFKAPFDGALHFSPYVAFNQRGFSYRPNSGSITEYQNTINYIDIVPALSTDFTLGENSVVISVGPHLSYAFSGKEKRTEAGITTKYPMKFSTAGYYGPFDLGFSSSLGFHTKKIFVEAGFQLGLSSINNEEEFDNKKIQNRMLSLNLGYYLK